MQDNRLHPASLFGMQPFVGQITSGNHIKTHQSPEKRSQIRHCPIIGYELHQLSQMQAKTLQIRHLLPRKNRHDNLSRMFPYFAIGNKNAFSDPACVGLPSDTLDAEIPKICGIDRLDVFHLAGVDDCLTKYVGLKCVCVLTKIFLKRILEIPSTFAGNIFPVQIYPEYGIFVPVLARAATVVALH